MEARRGTAYARTRYTSNDLLASLDEKNTGTDCTSG
jgi:hypothetical protein